MSGKAAAAAARAAERKARQASEIAREKERQLKLKAALYEGETALPKNVLAPFLPFTKFDRADQDLEIMFTSTEHPTWTPAIEKFAFDITKANMRELYAATPAWGWNDSRKRSELFDSDSRFLIVRQRGEGGAPVAFAMFRFLIEGDADVLYVFELQLTDGVQRKGLGKHLMQLMELIARKNEMQRVFLTVLKNNTSAIKFYTSLKYTIDDTSPSKGGESAGYEILSKRLAPPKTVVVVPTATTGGS